MIPVQGLAAKKDYGKDRKHRKGDYFLDNLELHQRKGPAVADEAHAVGRHLKAVLGKRDTPGKKYHDVERRIRRDYIHLLELEMSVPGECHEYVRYYKQ